MKEIRAQGLANCGRLEIGLRLVGPQHLDPRDGAKARAVIEAESCCDAIQLVGLDDPQRRTGRARHRPRRDLAGVEDARYGMARWRLIRKAWAAAQLPIAPLRSERSPHFARSPGIEGQRAPHLDIGQLD